MPTGRPTRPSSPARTRKAAAAGPAPRGAAELAAGARQGPLPRQPDPVPPPRLLPRHGPAMGFHARRVRDDADVLNLFGYTGVGTLSLSDAGARMVHVDASKKSVEGGRANAMLSGMGERPIRWIVDDAAKFTAREVRRGAALRRHPARPAQVRARPDRRSVAARGSSRAACSPTAAACSTRTAAFSC